MKSFTKSVPLYVQVLQRASLQLISPFLDPARDVIISMEQTRHRLLALSCLCPGASTLLGALRSCTMPHVLAYVLVYLVTLQLNLPFLDPARDMIISMEQTRHRLLALSCLCPGASSLLDALCLDAYDLHLNPCSEAP